jgi:hypothetical protein
MRGRRGRHAHALLLGGMDGGTTTPGVPTRSRSCCDGICETTNRRLED